MTNSTEHLRILSRPDWVVPVVTLLRDQLTARRPSEALIADRFLIAMTEALTNAIVHGNLEVESTLKEDEGAFGKLLKERSEDPAYYGRVVDIQVSHSESQDVWTVADEGNGFDVDAAVRRATSDDPDLFLLSGRGITLMKAFVDDVSWSDGGRQVTLTICGSGGCRYQQSAERLRYVASIRYDSPSRKELTALARDISVTGIGFVTTEPLSIDAPIRMTLSCGMPSQRMISGTVIRSRFLTSGFYDVAVSFDQRFDKRELTAVTEEAAHLAPCVIQHS